jgi:hypothetical protein
VEAEINIIQHIMQAVAVQEDLTSTATQQQAVAVQEAVAVVAR